MEPTPANKPTLERNVAVTVLRDDEEHRVVIRRGLGLQALSGRLANCPIEYDCRRADCGICIVRVRSGVENLSEPTPAEADFLRAMGADDDERLACQCRVQGPVTVEVEPEF